jgi:hypothetical protein
MCGTRKDDVDWFWAFGNAARGIEHLKAIVAKRSAELEVGNEIHTLLSAKVDIKDEALCLYSEVVKLLEAEAVVRPREVDALLGRIKALTVTQK